jgi:aromatic-L-amino-acid decarboxylase
MSLDPTDWAAVHAVGKRMLDDMLDYQETVRERAPWRPVPAEVRARLDEPIPFDGAPLTEIYESFRRDVLPYPTGNIHPRFWGWVMGTGTPVGMLAEMLAAGMNAHVAGYDQAASLIEKQVLKWLKSLMGFPEAASGLLVSGATAANLNGLLAARAAKAGWDIREDGLHAGPPLTIYGSSETHSWASKACDTMGMGRAAFRKVAVDTEYRLDLTTCRAMILADRRAGLRPIAVIGNVGTVNTGAVDDLHGIRALSNELDLWFHIDGAFGSLAAWSASRDLVAGQELADSIAFDLHKWGYMPYEVGVVLTRDADAQLAAFGPHADSAAYLLSLTRGISADTTYFADRGLQLTRGFRALKVWMSMKEQGVERIGAAIQANIDQARHLAGRIEAEPRLELLAPVSLNTVCFRYVDRGMPEERLDALNQEILIELQVRGIAIPSQTVLGGRFAIRVCITNHRSELSDFDALVEAVLALGEEILDRGTGHVAVSSAQGNRQDARTPGRTDAIGPRDLLNVTEGLSCAPTQVGEDQSCL